MAAVGFLGWRRGGKFLAKNSRCCTLRVSDLSKLLKVGQEKEYSYLKTTFEEKKSDFFVAL